jgi:hypothetical protein
VRVVLGLVAEMDDQERADLRAELDGVAAASPEEWERAWNDELSHRIGQVERGEVELLDGEAVMAKMRARLAS